MDSITFNWKAKFLHPHNGMRHTELNRELAQLLTDTAKAFALRHRLELEEASLTVQREPHPPPLRPSRPAK